MSPKNKGPGVHACSRMKSPHPSIDSLSLWRQSFSPSPTVSSYHFHHKNKKTIVQFAFLSHTLIQASVLSVCVCREPPVLSDSRPLLHHTSYCHCQTEDTHTFVQLSLWGLYINLHSFVQGPNRYIGLPVLSAHIGLFQIYQCIWYEWICPLISADIKTVLKLEKMLGLVI